MGTPTILVIDNYDSFVFNLVQYIAQLGGNPVTVRNDVVAADETGAAQLLTEHDPDGVLISPGPGYPQDAGVSNAMVRLCADRGLPLLGVCLGHQCIGEVFGSRIIHAPELLHGKTSQVSHNDAGVLAGLPSPFTATRYHSLVVDEQLLPAEIEVTGRTSTGTVMALRHVSLPIDGVQFHPESVLTERGYLIVGNWLETLGRSGAAQRADELDAALDEVRAQAHFALS